MFLSQFLAQKPWSIHYKLVNQMQTLLSLICYQAAGPSGKMDVKYYVA